MKKKGAVLFIVSLVACKMTGLLRAVLGLPCWYFGNWLVLLWLVFLKFKMSDALSLPSHMLRLVIKFKLNNIYWIGIMYNKLNLSLDFLHLGFFLITAGKSSSNALFFLVTNILGLRIVWRSCYYNYWLATQTQLSHHLHFPPLPPLQSPLQYLLQPPHSHYASSKIHSPVVPPGHLTVHKYLK